MSELESLRDVEKQLEQEKENVLVEVEEKLAQREEIWKARMAELDTALQASETKEKGLVQRLEIAENQLQEALNQSVGGQSFSVELSDLQFQFTELLKEKQTLESEVGRLNAELDEEKAKMNNAAAKIDLANKEMEEIQCQMTGYVRAAEASKEEALEMEAQLEAIKASQLNQNGKGNSLFSEVNDRREKVEDQLKVFEEKYNTLKENYTLKCDQLQKTKMHNAQLLSIAGTRNDSNHTGRLEELLEAERNKNKTLSSRLDLLEKLGSESEPIRNVDPFVGAKNQESEVLDNSSVQHTATEEYNYLTTMLNESKRRNAALQKEIQLQCRQNLEDSEKLRDMTRRVHQSEVSLQKVKAENYSLKMKIDDLKSRKGDQKVNKKEPVKVKEMLNFEIEKTLNKEVEAESFVLKETVVNRNAGSEPPPPRNASPKEEKENVPQDGNCSEKKNICFAGTVEEISASGESEAIELRDHTPKPKIRTSKPKGKKQFGAQNTIVVADQEGAECKQQ